jgi:hypothetical protein
MQKPYFYHSAPTEGEQRMTIAGIKDEDGLIKLGIAKCSLKDTFSKAKGRELALERAAKSQLGTIQIGKNKHVGVTFRFLAQGIISSMMSNDFKFKKPSGGTSEV